VFRPRRGTSLARGKSSRRTANVEKQLARAFNCARSPAIFSVCTTAVRLRTWRRMLSGAALLQGGSAELLVSALRAVELETIADAA
jgi:hypothetical protein